MSRTQSGANKPRINDHEARLEPNQSRLEPNESRLGDDFVAAGVDGRRERCAHPSRPSSSCSSASLLTACSGSSPEEDGADPEPAAQALAEGLAAGDLSEVDLADPTGVAEQLTDILDGMGDLTPRVEVTDVTESDATATATLGWSWSITEQDWTYTTTAQLSRVGEAWVVEWEPSIVEPSLRRRRIAGADRDHG